MSMDDYYESIASNIVRQWKDWLKENGHLQGELAAECEDRLVELIAARLRMKGDE